MWDVQDEGKMSNIHGGLEQKLSQEVLGITDPEVEPANWWSTKIWQMEGTSEQTDSLSCGFLVLQGILNGYDYPPLFSVSLQSQKISLGNNFKRGNGCLSSKLTSLWLWLEQLRHRVNFIFNHLWDYLGYTTEKFPQNLWTRDSGLCWSHMVVPAAVIPSFTAKNREIPLHIQAAFSEVAQAPSWKKALPPSFILQLLFLFSASFWGKLLGLCPLIQGISACWTNSWAGVTDNLTVVTLYITTDSCSSPVLSLGTRASQRQQS